MSTWRFDRSQARSPQAITHVVVVVHADGETERIPAHKAPTSKIWKRKIGGRWRFYESTTAWNNAYFATVFIERGEP